MAADLETLRQLAALLPTRPTVSEGTVATVFVVDLPGIQVRARGDAMVGHMLEAIATWVDVTRARLDEAEAFGEVAAVEAARAAHDDALRNLNEARAIAGGAS